MINYYNGDLLSSNCAYICHQVNCKGVMGSGIAKQIREAYPQVYEEYKVFCNSTKDKLGSITISRTPNCNIVNFFSQDDYLPRGKQHTNYEAFRTCCKSLHDYLYSDLSKLIANKMGENIDYFRKRYIPNTKIGFPYGIGCGLGGGDWDVVQNIIKEVFHEDVWSIEIWKL